MKNYFIEPVDETTFEWARTKNLWAFNVPLRKRYERFIPKQAFLLGEDECLVLDGPKFIRFRKRWSFKTTDREIRLMYIVNNEIDPPYFKLHLL